MGQPTSAWIAFWFLLTAAVGLLAAVFLPLWKPLFMAAVLAGALARWHDRVAHRLGGRRPLSAGIMTIALVTLFLLPLAVLSVVAVRETIEGVDFIRQTLRAGGTAGLTDLLPDRVETWVERLLALIPRDLKGLSAEAASRGWAAAQVVSTALSATSAILFDLALLLIAFYFFLVDGHRLHAWVEQASPLQGQLTLELLGEFRKVSQSVLGSTVLTALVQCVAATAGYLLARVPHPFFFGLATFFAAFIPGVGTAVVALPLAGLIALTGHSYAALFLVGWALVVVGGLDNVLKPLLMRGGTQLHGAVVLFSLIGGLLLFGPVGLLAGPLSVTFFLTMVRLGRRDFSMNQQPSASAEPGETPEHQPDQR